MTNISVQTSKGTEGKALHKPDVCDAKYAKQYVTSKSVQIEKGTEEKHYTNPVVFEQMSLLIYDSFIRPFIRFKKPSLHAIYGLSQRTVSLRFTVCTDRVDRQNVSPDTRDGT